MEYLCLNKANVVVLSLGTLLSIYRPLCSSKVSGQLWASNLKHLVSKWLGCNSLYTAEDSRLYHCFTIRRSRKHSMWTSCEMHIISLLKQVEVFNGFIPVSKYRLLLLGILPKVRCNLCMLNSTAMNLHEVSFLCIKYRERTPSEGRGHFNSCSDFSHLGLPMLVCSISLRILQFNVCNMVKKHNRDFIGAGVYKELKFI